MLTIHPEAYYPLNVAKSFKYYWPLSNSINFLWVRKCGDEICWVRTSLGTKEFGYEISSYHLEIVEGKMSLNLISCINIFTDINNLNRSAFRVIFVHFLLHGRSKLPFLLTDSKFESSAQDFRSICFCGILSIGMRCVEFVLAVK